MSINRMRIATPSRRELLFGGGMGLGSVALSAMMATRGPHHKARAKNCIFLLMEGGPSHIDTFDPKPRLASLSQFAFYLLLFKLSVHFCRFLEGVDRGQEGLKAVR